MPSKKYEDFGFKIFVKDQRKCYLWKRHIDICQDQGHFDRDYKYMENNT